MANELSGHLLVLKTPTGGMATQAAQPSNSDFDNYTGFQSNNLDFSATVIDVTNKSTSENMTILDSRGIKSFTVSGSGFIEDEALHKEIEANMLSQTLRWFQIERSDGSGRTYTAKWKISAYSFDGSYDGAVNFSITLNSSGAVVVA